MTVAKLVVSDPTRGIVKSSNHFSGWLAMNISEQQELKNFPFDFHDLKIIVRPHKHDKAKVLLMKWEGMAAVDTAVAVNEWTIVGHRSQIKDTDPSISTTGKVYSFCEIDTMVERAHMWYTLNVVCYMGLIVFLSFGTFFLPANAIDTRWEGLLAMLLVILATKFPISDVIPRVWYFTLFDEYMLLCYILVASNAFSVVFIYFVFYKLHPKTHFRLQRG
jgi:hypothetical protein